MVQVYCISKKKNFLLFGFVIVRAFRPPLAARNEAESHRNFLEIASSQSGLAMVASEARQCSGGNQKR